MKNLSSFAPAIALAFVSVSAPAADKAKDTIAPPEPVYNTSTVIDVVATVTAVREVPKGSSLAGVHLMLQSGTDNLDVYIGPSEFVKIFDVTFAKGDTIHVIGSKVTFQDSTVVLAREVIMGTVTLSLRDNSGEPLWKFFLGPPVG
jgi:hypothetical protein